MRLSKPKYDLTTIINEDGVEEETIGAYVFHKPTRELRIYKTYFPPAGFMGRYDHLINEDYESFY